MILKYFSELPDSVLDIIIGDSTYNDIYISKEDKITTIRVLVISMLIIRNLMVLVVFLIV